MKLLFDHRLSPTLVARLGELFPESDHVWHLGLHDVPDESAKPRYRFVESGHVPGENLYSAMGQSEDGRYLGACAAETKSTNHPLGIGRG